MSEALQRDEEGDFKVPSQTQNMHNKPAEFYHRLNLLSNKELVDKVLEFCVVLSGKNWYTYQKAFSKRIIESCILNDGEAITGLWSRQSGKTETVANTVLGMAIVLPTLATQVFPDDPRLKIFANGFWAGVFAPIQEQADISHTRMRELVETDLATQILAECEEQIVTNRGGNVTFGNGSYIHSRSASPDSKVEGKTYHLVIIEEAQLVGRYKVNKEISPMLAATNGTMVKIGTAHMSKGGFHTTIQYNVTVYKRGGVRNHFEFPYDLVIREKTQAYKKDGNPFHLQYERWVNKEIARLGGKENEEFQMNFMLKWKESRRIAIDEDSFAALGNPELESNVYTKQGYQVASIDVGKDNDSTVVTIMRVWKENPIVDPSISKYFGTNEETVFYKKTILGWLTLSGRFEGDNGQYNRVCQYLSYWNIKRMFVDATGMGDPVSERFEVLLPKDIEVVAFKYSTQSKSDLYKYYLQELGSGRIEYPAGKLTKDSHEYKEFVKQHINLDREYRGEYLVCEAAEGEHDDYPDSAAVACWATKGGAEMPTIETTHLPQKGKSDIASWNKTNPVKKNRYQKRW